MEMAPPIPRAYHESATESFSQHNTKPAVACWASSVNNPAPSALPDKSPPCERDYEGGFATSLMLKVCFIA